VKYSPFYVALVQDFLPHAPLSPTSFPAYPRTIQSIIQHWSPPGTTSCLPLTPLLVLPPFSTRGKHGSWMSPFSAFDIRNPVPREPNISGRFFFFLFFFFFFPPTLCPSTTRLTSLNFFFPCAPCDLCRGGLANLPRTLPPPFFCPLFMLSVCSPPSYLSWAQMPENPRPGLSRSQIDFPVTPPLSLRAEPNRQLHPPFLLFFFPFFSFFFFFHWPPARVARQSFPFSWRRC